MIGWLKCLIRWHDWEYQHQVELASFHNNSSGKRTFFWKTCKRCKDYKNLGHRRGGM